MPNMEQLDLVFTRDIDVPPSLVWRAWTEPALLVQWFTPEPWRTVDCQIDLRPGGAFRTTMRSPEGQDFPNEGCYLDVAAPHRLAWTNALEAGFRPASNGTSEHCGGFKFTAILTIEPHGGGSRYTARVLHSDEAGRKQHEEMGFFEGWGKALDQLVALAKQL